MWCHPQSPAIPRMPQVLGQGLGKGGGIQGTKQHSHLLIQCRASGETRMGKYRVEPSRAEWTGVVWWQDAVLASQGLPLRGCRTALCEAEPEQYKMLDNKQRPREPCLPLGIADNHLGSLCLFRQMCLLEPGFWPSLGDLASLRASAPASGEWD